jgi:hypothetical protein
MKSKIVLLIILITAVIFILGCGNNNEFNKDVTSIAETMCKITGVMNKLRVADPADSVLIAGLQKEEKQYESEMTTLNHEFREKYKSKLSDKKFREVYSREFRKAILKCPHLSEVDRERFKKETE